MPKTRRTESPPEHSPDPIALVRHRADALFRAAIECCRQHDRAAKLHNGAEPDLEHEHVDALCAMCDGSLREMADAYETAAASVHPDGDQAWWHRANALWHACREYGRRHLVCDAMGRKLSAKHAPAQLASLQLEYELEASALLAMRQAADAYRKTRPDLH